MLLQTVNSLTAVFSFDIEKTHETMAALGCSGQHSSLKGRRFKSQLVLLDHVKVSLVTEAGSMDSLMTLMMAERVFL